MTCPKPRQLRGAALAWPFAGSESCTQPSCREQEPLWDSGQPGAGPSMTDKSRAQKLRRKQNGDTYAMFNSFCSVGSFLFCIIMSQNVNNCHKVHLFPGRVCKGMRAKLGMSDHTGTGTGCQLGKKCWRVRGSGGSWRSLNTKATEALKSPCNSHISLLNSLTLHPIPS